MISICILAPAVVFCKIVPESQLIYLKNSATMECISRTAPVWTFNNSIVPKLYGQITLTIDKVELDNAGIYHCYGTDAKHNSFVAASTLIVGSTFKF